MSVEPSDKSPTVETIIRELGRTDASGVLELRHQSGVPSYVWVRGGRIYAMQVPGYRPALGIRLLSGGLVSPEQLSAAAAEQRERRPGQLIGEVLVGMGYVSTDVIDSFVRQQVIDQLGDLLDMDIVSAEFHVGRHIRQGMSEPNEVEQLVVEAKECRSRSMAVLAQVGGPSVVPVLGPSQGGPSRTPLGPYDWALLCRVDGTRDLTELARVCGFTVMEAAQVVSDLMKSGLLGLPQPTADDEQAPLAPVVALHSDSPPATPQWRFDGTDVGDPDPVHTAPPPADLDDSRGALMAEFGALLRDEPPATTMRREDPPTAPEPSPPPTPGAPLNAASDHDDQASTPPQATPAPSPSHVPPATTSTEDLVAADGAPAARPPIEALDTDGPPAGLAAVAAQSAEPGLALVHNAGPSALSLVHASQRPPLTEVDPPPPATEPIAHEGPSSGAETTAFMRELSSLSDDPDRPEPEVRRLVVPLREQRRKRRPWSR